MYIVIDTREQAPLPIPPPVRRAALPVGDYAIMAYDEKQILTVVERKSIADAIASVRKHRPRFRREWILMSHLRPTGRAAVLIVGVADEWDAAPPGVHGTYQSWSDQYGVVVHRVDNRADAARWVFDFLTGRVDPRTCWKCPAGKPSPPSVRWG